VIFWEVASLFFALLCLGPWLLRCGSLCDSCLLSSLQKLTLNRRLGFILCHLHPRQSTSLPFPAHNTARQQWRKPTLSYLGCLLSLCLYISRFYVHVNMYPYEPPLQRARVGRSTLRIHPTPLLCLYLPSLMPLLPIRSRLNRILPLAQPEH
jgi:hypothetical protein